ncbi:hypothetical protein WAX74_03980 [Psychrobacillus sp. FJAT-51614]|uniref:DUF3899 domain-containing protein n=1 Tax=Psychrobacillus mangrovi TaxID=3117745 RepID=A0ABU8F1D1_9BACI
MAFKKELKKVKILLIIGIILAIAFVVSVMIEYQTIDIFDGGLYVIFTVALYPLGIVYGWRYILGYASYTEPYLPADRYYTVQERNIYHNGRLMGTVLRIGLALCLGWIVGVFIALKKLNQAKRYDTQNSNY